MTIEDFARYIDAIAPDAPGTPVGRADGEDGPADRRRTPARRRPMAAALVAATIATVLVASILVLVDGSDPATEVTTGPADGDGGSGPPWIGWPRPDEPGTSDETVTTEPTHGAVTLRPPGGPVRIEVGFTDEHAEEAHEVAVVHLVAFTVDGHRFDVELHEAVELPFDPCVPVEPCTEVREPVVSPSGMVVRAWAPTLLAGASPTVATRYTVEPPGGDVALALHAVYASDPYASTPISGEQLALAVDQTTDDAGRRTVVARLDSGAVEATWWDTLVRPASKAWALAFGPGCELADVCSLGVGVRSLPVPSDQGLPREVPYDRIVASLEIESGGG